MARALLVPDQHVPERRGPQRVIGRKYRAAGKPEDHLDALLLQTSHQRLGSGELHGIAPYFEGPSPTKNLLAIVA